MPEGRFDAFSDLAAHRVGILLARRPDDPLTSFTIAATTTSLSMAFPNGEYVMRRGLWAQRFGSHRQRPL